MCFRLNDDEKAALAKRNGEYEKPLKSQPEIEDIITQAKKNNLVWSEMTLTQFKEQWPSLRQYTVQQISAVVKRLEIEGRRTDKGRWYSLPTSTADTYKF